MKNFLALYFYYTRQERIGILVMVILLVSILAVYKILPTPITNQTDYIDFTSLEKAIAQFDNNNASNGSITEGGQSSANSANITLFPFNPNTATFENFISLGLSPRIAKIIEHYREKGGQFRKPEDLKRIYGITNDDYARLEEYIEIDDNIQQRPTTAFTNRTYDKFTTNKPSQPIVLKPFDPNIATENDLLALGLDEKTVKILLKYREHGGIFRKKEDLKKLYNFSEIDFLRLEAYIQIPDNQNVTTEKGRFPKTPIDEKEIIKKNVPIDVNKATLEEWLELRGIGRTFAGRIIEYREKIGGFASLDQLKEVYGLPDSTLRIIAPYLKLTTVIYRRLHINKATTDALIHPYLTRKQAEAVVRFRVNHGDFKNMNDVKQIGVFDNSILEKLQPYIAFD